MKTLRLFIAILLLLIVSKLGAQNIAITDDNGYKAHTSAMLDVKSVSKGFLAPRMSSLQRLAILSPAEGLMVFDVTDKCFYYYSNGQWTKISSGMNFFSLSNNKVFMSDTTLSFGIGTSNPGGKFEVKESASSGVDDPLFEVKNKAGEVVFGVYPGGVRVYVDTVTSKGARGGFAVGGRRTSKGTEAQYMYVTPDSVRIYIDSLTTKGAKGGFAVGGRRSSKGSANDYMRVTSDSVRIYLDEPQKGARGGFAVGGRRTSKGENSNFMFLTPQNYFIGHDAGHVTSTGLYNSFIGYQSGYSNLEGSNNSFLGYQSGYYNKSGESNVYLGLLAGVMNDSGSYNVSIGNYAGYSNTSDYNVFVGQNAGAYNEGGSCNVYIGLNAGYETYEGNYNVAVGTRAGYSNKSGVQNVFIGQQAGENDSTGSYNTFVGSVAGYSNTHGSSNVFIGQASGFSNTEGENNVFIGTDAGQYSQTGDRNVFLGMESGSNNTDGNYNLLMGYRAGGSLTSGISNIMIGDESGSNSTGNGNVFIGDWAGRFNTAANNNVFIGREAGYSNTDSEHNTFIGYTAGNNNTGGWNTFFGSMAGYDNTTGEDNTFLGFNAGSRNTTGSNNIYLGRSAGIVDDYTGANGSNNVMIGNHAGGNETGSNKLYIENYTAAATSDGSLIYGEFDNKILRFNANVGVNSNAYTDAGIRATSTTAGVVGEVGENSSENYGVWGYTSGGYSNYSIGVFGQAEYPSNSYAYAGYFIGNVFVSGDFSASGSKNFFIDHPVDPENKTLKHAAVESPDLKNVYDGVVMLDANGEATIALPSYFEALNKDFRYQLTPIGASSPDLYIAQEVTDNAFKIAGGKPNMKVSWMVTGIRKDPYALQHPIKVEEEKADNQKGLYLNPEVYNQPKSKAIFQPKSNKKK